MSAVIGTTTLEAVLLGVFIAVVIVGALLELTERLARTWRSHEPRPGKRE